MPLLRKFPLLLLLVLLDGRALGTVEDIGPTTTSSLSGKLLQLKDAHKAGLLTDLEWARTKKELLQKFSQDTIAAEPVKETHDSTPAAAAAAAGALPVVSNGTDGSCTHPCRYCGARKSITAGASPLNETLRPKDWPSCPTDKGSVTVFCMGQMSNNMIEYLISRLWGQPCGLGVDMDSLTMKIPCRVWLANFSRVEAYDENMCLQSPPAPADHSLIPARHHPDTPGHGPLGGLEPALPRVPAEKRTRKPRRFRFARYGQYYRGLRHGRDFAKWLFQISPDAIQVDTKVSSRDAVVHLRFRDPEARGHLPIINPTFAYYKDALQRAGGRQGFDRIWIACHETMWNHSIPVKLLQEYPNARLHGGSPTEDMWLATANKPKAFIGSFGTFSWMMAFLTEAPVIHLPYDKNQPDPGWVPWCELFIDDDPRITMTKVGGGGHIQAVDFRHAAGIPAWTSCLNHRKSFYQSKVYAY